MSAGRRNPSCFLMCFPSIPNHCNRLLARSATTSFGFSSLSSTQVGLTFLIHPFGSYLNSLDQLLQTPIWQPHLQFDSLDGAIAEPIYQLRSCYAAQSNQTRAEHMGANALPSLYYASPPQEPHMIVEPYFSILLHIFHSIMIHMFVYQIRLVPIKI